MLRDGSIEERERTCRGLHSVRGIDVVLDQNRHAMQGASGPFRLRLSIERVGDGESVRIYFDHRSQRRTTPVNLLDSIQVALDEIVRCWLCLRTNCRRGKNGSAEKIAPGHLHIMSDVPRRLRT